MIMLYIFPKMEIESITTLSKTIWHKTSHCITDSPVCTQCWDLWMVIISANKQWIEKRRSRPDYSSPWIWTERNIISLGILSEMRAMLVLSAVLFQAYQTSNESPPPWALWRLRCQIIFRPSVYFQFGNGLLVFQRVLLPVQSMRPQADIIVPYIMNSMQLRGI